MSYTPKFQAQLGRGPTSDVDCGPRTWQMMVDYLTRGDKRPGPEETRDRADCGNGTTNVDDARRAVESYVNVKGRAPLRYYRKGAIDDVKEAVRAGKPVHLCIDYGTLNDKADHTGDPHFRGGHSVLVLGRREVDGGTVQWHLWDPLMDGRRPEISQSPVWIKMSILVASAEDFAGGSGECYAGVGGGGGKET